jgi:hypothetical protein
MVAMPSDLILPSNVAPGRTGALVTGRRMLIPQE